MREAVASVIYASSRLMDVPELTQVAQGLGGKFGRDFVRACSCERAEDLPKDVREKHPENPRSWVSRQLVSARGASRTHLHLWHHACFTQSDAPGACRWRG